MPSRPLLVLATLAASLVVPADALAGTAVAASDPPGPLIVLAVLGGLVLLVLLAWALARFLAYDPEWLRASRHAIAEAGWRTGGAWEDFRDWLRGGRGASSR